MSAPELLPLVEFKVEEGISDSEACSLLELEPAQQTPQDPFETALQHATVGGGVVVAG